MVRSRSKTTGEACTTATFAVIEKVFPSCFLIVGVLPQPDKYDDGGRDAQSWSHLSAEPRGIDRPSSPIASEKSGRLEKLIGRRFSIIDCMTSVASGGALL